MNILQGLEVISSASEYMDNRKSGKGVVTSAGKAAFNYAKFEILGPVMLPKLAADLTIGASRAVYKKGRQTASQVNNAYGAQFGGNYQDTQNAYTMRQRGVQAIQNNGLNARSVLGSEARQYIRGGY